MTHNVIDSIFLRRVGQLLCSGQFFPCVKSVSMFLNRLVRHVFFMSLCHFFASGTNTDRSIETAFLHSSSSIALVVGNWSIIRNDHVLPDSSIFFDLVATRSAEDVVIDGRSRQRYCPTVNDSSALRAFHSLSYFYRRCNVLICFSASLQTVIIPCRTLALNEWKDVAAVCHFVKPSDYWKFYAQEVAWENETKCCSIPRSMPLRAIILLQRLDVYLVVPLVLRHVVCSLAVIVVLKQSARRFDLNDRPSC